MPNVHNLVFSGGGVKATAYVGAIQVLEEHKVLTEVQRIAGSSSGALISVLLGLGCNAKEIDEMFWTLDFKKMGDCFVSLFEDIRRFFINFGLCKGDYLSHWIEEQIKKKTGNPHSTFAELKARQQKGEKQFKDIYIMILNLSTGYTEAASFENPKWRDLPLALAVRASMAYPLLYGAVTIKDQIYIDGGVTLNYPITFFDKLKYLSKVSLLEGCDPNIHVFNTETLGVRLDSKETIDIYKHIKEPSIKKITDLPQFLKAMLEAFNNAQDDILFSQQHRHRTIFCDTLDVITTDFNITPEKRKALIESGKKCAVAYFREEMEAVRPDGVDATAGAVKKERVEVLKDHKEEKEFKEAKPLLLSPEATALSSPSVLINPELPAMPADCSLQSEMSRLSLSYIT